MSAPIGPGYIVRRCRSCGEVEDAVHVPDVLQALVELLAHGKVISWGGIPCRLVGLHDCRPGVEGLTDVVGGRLDDVPLVLTVGSETSPDQEFEKQVRLKVYKEISALAYDEAFIREKLLLLLVEPVETSSVRPLLLSVASRVLGGAS